MSDEKDDSDDAKGRVAAILDELRNATRAYTIEDLKDGSWFAKLVHMALRTYSEKVNAEYFAKKYPGLPRDAVVDKQIKLARTYAAIEGATTGTAYSAMVVATIGSGGGASPYTLPGAIGSFAIDLYFTTQLQLRLAYDMAVLYGVPIDLQDPDDLLDLLKIAFGIKAGEVATDALTKLAPEATRVGVKAVFRGSLLEFLKALPIVGKYLLQRNLIKFAIPIVTVPLSGGMNWVTTNGVGKRAREVFRGRAAIREEASRVSAGLEEHAGLLVRTLWFVVNADRKIANGELRLLRDVARSIVDGDQGDALRDVEATINLDVDDLLERIRPLPIEIRTALYEAAVVAAAVDRKVHEKELDALRMLASACAVEFREEAIHEAVRRLADA